MTPLEKRRSLRKAAMPEVAKLVRKFGRKTISGCIQKMKDQEKITKRIAFLKKEAAELERKI